jgi:hypothetical protein
MKTLLRARFAQTARETGKGTTPKDFENIGTAFHKWVREQVDAPDTADPTRKAMRLTSPDDFERFVNDMRIHARRYATLVQVSRKLTTGWEHVYFNASNDFTLQYLLALAVSEVSDAEEVFQQKVGYIAEYIDIFVARRMVNFKRRGYSSMYRRIFTLAKDLRGLNVEQVRLHLARELESMEEDFSGVGSFALTNTNKPDVYYLLARLTSWLEGDGTDRYFKGGSSPEPFEVEHVWANKFERHEEEFTNENEFQQARNRFGALLLLPKSFNASYGALPYEDKVNHYLGQNALAQTLAKGLGKHNPNLHRKAEQLSVPIEGYPTSFEKKDIESRQHLYRELCEVVWSADKLFSPQSSESS